MPQLYLQNFRDRTLAAAVGTVDFLLSDRTGENYVDMLDAPSSCRDMPELMRCDCISLLVDGDQLAAPERRHIQVTRTRRLWRALAENAVLGRSWVAAQVVLTKLDVLQASPEADRAVAAFDSLAGPQASHLTLGGPQAAALLGWTWLGGQAARDTAAGEWHPAFRHAPVARPGTCPCSAASARPVATGATTAGRFAPVARARSATHRRAVSGPRRPPARGRAAVPGGPCVLTRCRVVRGGGVRRGAGRRRRPCGAADGLAPPAPVARDTRRVGPRRRAVPARG